MSPQASDRAAPHSSGVPRDVALAEWHFTGVVEDIGNTSERCQLCTHTLRYRFDIARGEQHLWVGNECVVNFRIAVYADGSRLTGKALEAYLRAKLKAAKLERCMNLLEAAAQQTNNEILVEAVRFFRLHAALSPKLAFVVLWQLPKLGSDVEPADFIITTRTKRHQHDLRDMPTSRVQLLWPALNASQRKTARRWHDLA
jgi:hypothetical protein